MQGDEKKADQDNTIPAVVPNEVSSKKFHQG